MLLHPVISTFIKLKWAKAKTFFRRRVRLLWLFVIIVLSEVFNEYQATIVGYKNEVESIRAEYVEKKGPPSCVEYVSRWFLALIVPLLLLWADQVQIDIEVIQQGLPDQKDIDFAAEVLLKLK